MLILLPFDDEIDQVYKTPVMLTSFWLKWRFLQAVNSGWVDYRKNEIIRIRTSFVPLII